MQTKAAAKRHQNISSGLESFPSPHFNFVWGKRRAGAGKMLTRNLSIGTCPGSGSLSINIAQGS